MTPEQIQPVHAATTRPRLAEPVGLSSSVPPEDPTEAIRRRLVVQMNAQPVERAALEAQHGPVWDPEELARDFKVIGFMAPFVVVRRKADGAVGSLLFQHQPRYYFGWRQDN